MRYKVLSRKMRTWLIPLVIVIVALFTHCTTDKHVISEQNQIFDKAKWATKDGKDYPYRESMLNSILKSDSIRSLNKDGVLALLGEPSYYRENKNYLYYRISETRIGPWPLLTETMVVKINSDESIAWIKMHGEN